VRIGAVAGLALLAACGSAPEPGRVARIGAEQCFASLARLDNLRFRRVPDSAPAPGCGLSNAVQILDVGVVVRGAGAMSCPTVLAFHRWLRETARPAALRRFGSELVGIDSYGTYACRPRNNMAGAQPSEHATANAIDIAGFRLRDGRRLTVLAGWSGDDPQARAFLRDLHRGGCRDFAVTLGPDANAQHLDHFHFDMGRGPYCR
jgi:hypothetical protein